MPRAQGRRDRKIDAVMPAPASLLPPIPDPSDPRLLEYLNLKLREIGQPSAEEAATIVLFEKGLTCYRARQWDEAEACLKQVMEKWAGDGPSEKYLDDIEDKRQHPPPDGWDGTYVMKTK